MISLRRKFWAVAAALGLGMVLLLYTNYRLVNRIRSVSEEIGDIKSQLEVMSRKFIIYSFWSSGWQELEEGLDTIEGSFVNPEDPLPLLEFIEAAAAADELETSISSITFSEGEEGPMGTGEVRLSVQGPAEDAQRFLERLQNAPFMMEVKDSSFFSLEEGGSKLNLTLEFVTYERD